MSYSDARYGLVRRIVAHEKDDAGVTGVSEAKFSFPKKTKIIKFGVIPYASDVLVATNTNFTLETDAGTDLGTFTPGASGELGTGTATGNTITATTVAANKVVVGNVTVAGSSGSFYWFVDVREQFDATADDANS